MSYTFSLSRRSLPVRCLCLLLIAVLLFCFFMCPRAGAVALEASTVAYAGLLVGTLLVGAGVAFSNPGDMAKAGDAMYRTLQKGNEAIASKIAAISVWAVEHGKSIGSAALRIGKDLYQGIVDAFKSAYSGGYFYGGDHISIAQHCTNADMLAFSNQLIDYVKSPCTFTVSFYSRSSGQLETETYVVTYPDGYPYLKNIAGYGYGFSEPTTFEPRYGYNSSYNDNSVGFAMKNGHGGSYAFSWTTPVIASIGDVIAAPADDLAYPSDDYLVRMPDIPSVDSATGAVTYPDSIAYTKDAVVAPYPIGDDGVKVPDIPYDIPVDQTSGKPMDDTGTDTDTPSKPGEGTDTGSNTGLLQKILDLLKNFFDSPSDFRLNMDGFRNLAIADKFPFCIPFDLVDSIKQFAVTAKDFHFRIKLDTHYFKVDHEVDLSDMVLPFAFFRYMVLVWFVWTLMLRTRDLVKW